MNKDELTAETSPATSAVAAPAPEKAENSFAAGKRVLLVDINPVSRDERAKMMRARGVIVECVSTAGAARSRIDAAAFHLVLLDLGRDFEAAEKLAEQIKQKNSRQRVAFLVGSPLFLATSLSAKVPARAKTADRPPAPPQTASSNSLAFGQRIRDAEAEAEELKK